MNKMKEYKRFYYLGLIVFFGIYIIIHLVLVIKKKEE